MVNLTPCKAIRQFCVQCLGSQKAPRYCEDENCPLYPYRLGTNPKRKGIGGYTPKAKKRKPEVVSPTLLPEIKNVEGTVTGKKKIRIIIEDLEEEDEKKT